jgi:HPt (histidine-containing phosphotransfer) domain-containing protein
MKLQVLVDPDLADLVPGFLASKRNDADLIAAATEKADYDTLRELGHRLKGEGGGYGFDGISKIGAFLQQAAICHNLAAVREAHAALVEYLDSIELTQ